MGVETKNCRRFYLIFCAVLFVFSYLAHRHGHGVRSRVFFVLSVSLLALHFFQPRLSHLLYKVYTGFMTKIGALATKVFMVLFFYVIFFPYGLLLRLLKGDVLARKWERNRQSYWIPKPPAENEHGRCENSF